MHFGLGKDDSIYSAVVVWLDQKTQKLSNISPNHVITFEYKNASTEKYVWEQKQDPIFLPATQKLNINYSHLENEYEDFKKEILLPHKLSRYGPGLAVADVNGDGLEDYFVSGALRTPGSLYLQTTKMTFEKSTSQPWEIDKGSEILGVLFFDADNDGDMDLYATSGGNEFKVDDPMLIDYLYINDGKGNFTKSKGLIPDTKSSGSCVVGGDYDGDGDMDLFVGGRVVPANYPMPAKCSILRNDNGKFTDVTKEVAPALDKGGLICSAIFTDYNNDGKEDLIVAGEWTPIMIFKNTGGKFEETTKEAGLADASGWWNSIAAGDFDNDGDIDYVVGNEGLNTRYYQPTKEEPVEMFASDFDKNGTQDIVISVYNFGKSYPLKTRLTMAEQIPMIGEKFPLYKQFSLATTEDAFGKDALAKAHHFEAKTLASSYIENNGEGTFTVKQLPAEAQFSCIYGIIPFDVNSDGNLDIVAHGNFFSPESETERQDGCIGLTLIGDGKGDFKSMKVAESGFFSNKDAKALALIYVGKNQMPVILGTNNNDAMFAYEFRKNSQTKILLSQQDLFAEIYFKDGRKARHEVNIGSGYLSQGSNTISFNPLLIDKIVVTNNKGQQRNAFENIIVASK
jgi:hypothetical protein